MTPNNPLETSVMALDLGDNTSAFPRKYSLRERLTCAVEDMYKDSLRYYHDADFDDCRVVKFIYSALDYTLQAVLNLGVFVFLPVMFTLYAMNDALAAKRLIGRVRGITILSFALVGGVTLCVFGCGGGKKDEAAPQQEKESKIAEPNKTTATDQISITSASSIDNKPEVVAVRENNRRISESLNAVKGRLDKSKLPQSEEKLTKKQVEQTMEYLLSAADSACEDIDAVIRMAQRIAFDLLTAEKGYRNIAELYRERGKGTSDEVRSIYEQVAEHFDALANDTPRRRKLTENFQKELQDARGKFTEVTRGLYDLKAAYSTFPPNSLDELKVSPEGQAFQGRIDAFLSAVRLYHESYFAGDPFRGTGEKK